MSSSTAAPYNEAGGGVVGTTMARLSGGSNASAGSTRSLAGCGLCRGPLRDSRVLPGCLHSFCLACLQVRLGLEIYLVGYSSSTNGLFSGLIYSSCSSPSSDSIMARLRSTARCARWPSTWARTALSRSSVPTPSTTSSNRAVAAAPAAPAAASTTSTTAWRPQH